MLEINANPNRRDLPDVHARAAAEAGVPLLINCDAHRRRSFAVARYGIATARRAWLGPGHIANTRTWKAFQKLRKPGRT
jgi:DNA polymerase (family 10)